MDAPLTVTLVNKLGFNPRIRKAANTLNIFDLCSCYTLSDNSIVFTLRNEDIFTLEELKKANKRIFGSEVIKRYKRTEEIDGKIEKLFAFKLYSAK